LEINNIPDNRNSQESLLWDKIAESYVTTSVEENEVELAKEIEKIFKDYDIPIGAKLLEAGCGSGHLSGYLASKGYKTTLLDFSKVALEKAKEYYDERKLNGDFLLSDIFNLSEKSVGFYDVVWNSGVLEHFDGLQIIETLQKMTTITKNLVVILVPNPKCAPYMLFRKKAMERGQWTWGLEILRTSLKDLAEFAGLDVVEERPMGGNFCKSFIDYVNQEHQEQSTIKYSHDTDSTQKYLVALIAKPTKKVLALQDKADLFKNIFRKELEALRKTYQFDTSAMATGLDQTKILQTQKSETILELQQAKTQLEQDLTSKSNTVKQLEQDLTSKSNTVKQLEQDLTSNVKKIGELEKELSFQRERINQIYNSKSWKIGQLYAKKFGGTLVGKLGERVVNHLIKAQDYGVDQNISNGLQLTENKELIRKRSDQMHQIITDHAESKGIIIYPPTVDWNIPLLQRPQHMAQYMASKGWLYFYCTSNTYDKISGFQKLQHGLFLTDRYTDLVNNLDEFVFVVHSGHPTLTIDDIEKLKSKALIVYDYLDEIHPSVSGLQLQNVYARHKYLIENSDIVLVTADKLLFEVKQLRSNDVYLLSNGVDYEHFHVQKNPATIPGEIKKIIGNTNKTIVGYFGALASWVDYDLINYIATKRNDLEFVLIGWDYDGSLEKSNLLSIKNVHYLGVKGYEKLPDYAVWFDICILPFFLNEITHATSPIKLFEYMALGKPIISTPIKEALKYNSVIIADDKKQFVEKIDSALKLRDDDHYLELVDDEARINTWEIRFTQLDKILQDVIHAAILNRKMEPK